MATTAPSHQHRYKDYSGLPELPESISASLPQQQQQQQQQQPPSTTSARRDYMAQANKHSSRQTMTTVGSSSRFSNNNSELAGGGHNRLLDSSASNNYTPNTSSKSIRTHDRDLRRGGLDQGSSYNTPNTSSKSIRTHEDRERQRRAEENAAFVKMLEEESFMLQGGRLDKNQEKQRRERTSSGDFDRNAFPHPGSASNSYSRDRDRDYNRRSTYQPQQRQQSHSSTRSGRNPQPSPQHQQQRGRYSHSPQPAHGNHPQHHSPQAPPGAQHPAQHALQPPPQNKAYHPHGMYSPYHHGHDEDEQRRHRHEDRNRHHHNHNRDIPLDNYHHNLTPHSSGHNRDIPLEFEIPGSIPSRGVERGGSKSSRKSSNTHGFVPPSNPLHEQPPPQQEYELNLGGGPEDMLPRRSNHSEQNSHKSRQHPSQLRLLQRQPRRSLEEQQAAHAHQPAPHPSPSRQEYPLAQPNMMSLEQAIHSLELEGQQQQQQHQDGHHTPRYARRELPDDYDAILTGGTPRRDRDRSQRDHHRRKEDAHHYHNHSPTPPSKQQQHHHDIVLDHRHHHGTYPRDHQHAQQPPPQQQPQQPPPQQQGGTQQYEATRLMRPVEWVEFPVDWDGREIELTEDDELLDRDEDEYYRRRAAYRRQQQQQQQQQQSLQSIQSQSLQSQSLQSQSPSQVQQQRQRREIKRTVSRESYVSPHNHASDLYSQTMAHNGRRVPMQIEVSPGVSMPFRGSEETWEAIALNRIVRTSCLGCSIQLYCVEDAELVVCPDCQTMSPAHATEDPKAKRTGLGLGFKEEQLVQWRNAGP